MALREAFADTSSTLLSMLHTRFELFTLEASDQASRMVRLVVMALLAVFAVLLGVLVCSLTIALYFWPTEYRFVALWLLVLFYVVCALVLGWLVRRGFKKGPAPFSATLDELRRDIGMVKRLREPIQEERP